MLIRDSQNVIQLPYYFNSLQRIINNAYIFSNIINSWSRLSETFKMLLILMTFDFTDLLSGIKDLLIGIKFSDLNYIINSVFRNHQDQLQIPNGINFNCF